MRCSNCDKTISWDDNFCRFCGKPVVTSPSSPQASFRPASGEARIPIELGAFEPAEILITHSGATWGAHICSGQSQSAYKIKRRPESCPTWVKSNDWQCWFRRGLTVWDHGAQRIGTLLAGQAIEILRSLEAGDAWKTEGIALVEQRTYWPASVGAPRGKRLHEKNTEPKFPVEQPIGKSTIHEQEFMRLTGSAAEEFLAYLRDNEAPLRRMAEEEEALQQKISQDLFKLVVKAHRDHELKGFNGAGRKFPWVRQEYSSALICDVPPDRGTITLSESGFWWFPVIERPGHFKYDGERFVVLEEAAAWVEQKIPELRAQDEERKKNREREEAEEEAKIAALPKKDLTPYWIDPTDLEPEQIAYRAVIEVEYVPYASKTWEISFGQKQPYADDVGRPTRDKPGASGG